jgi:hypothetical protein
MHLFSIAYLEITSKLSVLSLEQFGMGDRPESFLGCTWVRTKCAQKTRVGLWGQYMILESCQDYISLVREWTGCYKWYESRPSRFHGRVWARGFGYMAHVGPEWSHGMAYDDTRHTDVAKRGGSWRGVPPRARPSSTGGGGGLWYPGPWDGDILAQGLIELIEYP